MLGAGLSLIQENTVRSMTPGFTPFQLGIKCQAILSAPCHVQRELVWQTQLVLIECKTA